MTDTANTLYGQEITGNPALPKTKARWLKQTVELRRKLQLLFHGGVGPTNVRNVYGCAEDEEVVADLRTTVDDTLVPSQALSEGYYSIGEQYTYRDGGAEDVKRRLSDPESQELARPSSPRASAPIIGKNRVGDVQESSDSMAGKTLVGETTELLPSSMAPSTQTVYLRGWKFRIRYCDSMGVSPWIDMSQPQWDLDLLHYPTWGHRDENRRISIGDEIMRYKLHPSGGRQM